MFRCLFCLIATALLAAGLYFGHGILLDKAGQYLVKRDELKPADAIVVLGGEKEERVIYGVKLFKDGWARKDRIIMTGGPFVWKYTYAGLMKEQAEALGVPSRNIILEDMSGSTEEDAIFVKGIAVTRGYKSLLLVTSPYHSRRAALIFRRICGGDIKVISAPVPAEDSWLKFDEWWKRPRERDMVLNEFTKFIRLWIFGAGKDRDAKKAVKESPE